MCARIPSTILRFSFDFGNTAEKKDMKMGKEAVGNITNMLDRMTRLGLRIG